MCDQTQGLPAQQMAPDSPGPFPSRETTAFPHVARMQSKRLSKCADEAGKKAIRLLRPKEKAVGLSEDSSIQGRTRGLLLFIRL